MDFREVFRSTTICRYIIQCTLYCRCKSTSVRSLWHGPKFIAFYSWTNVSHLTRQVANIFK